MWKKCKEFIAKETVLVAAALLAAVSVCFVPVSKEYAEYIDWRTLGILLALMLVMAGFQKIGIFRYLGICLLKGISNTRQLGRVLVYLCFFSGMLITNDVALLTFVPFAILTLKQAKREDLLLKVVVLQTIAANLGSMLTPIGNPQNLYLYNLAGLSLSGFIKLMLPYTMVSLGLLLITILFSKKEDLVSQGLAQLDMGGETEDNKFYVHTLIYLFLFVLSLLTVAHIVPWQLVVLIVMGVVFFTDSKMFGKVDYSLLITFVAFFIFIGNMGQIPAVKSWILSLVQGRELLMSVVASQVISNVPAAILLSGFTDQYEKLIVGTNLGGLGTLIASMASLISYKFYVREYPKKKGQYFWYFTIMNLFFIMVLVVTEVLLA